MSADPMKQRILGEATKLFAQAGADGTSLQTVSDAVGIRKPSLLYHYRSKDELRDAVLEQLLGHWKDDLPRVLQASSSGKDRLNSALLAMMGFFLDQPDRARLLVREMLDRPQAVKMLLEHHLRPWTRLLTDYIELGKSSGHVRPDLDPSAYVLQIVMMVVGTVSAGSVHAAMLSHPPSFDDQVAEIVRIAKCSLFTDRPQET